jgi:hypothetical protein|tara:strand:- start:1342 stop:1530 length:189 start_codon:yes stop_codon:yes gene_type:complete
MTNLLEIKRVGNTPVLVTTSNYNALDFSEKLKCLVNIRTAIEKEISWVEKDLGKFVSKRRIT